MSGPSLHRTADQAHCKEAIQTGSMGTNLTLKGCLRLLQLYELSTELGHAVLSSLHSSRRVTILRNDSEDALNALHAVGALLGGGFQPGKELLRSLSGVTCCLCISAVQEGTDNEGTVGVHPDRVAAT